MRVKLFFLCYFLIFCLPLIPLIESTRSNEEMILSLKKIAANKQKLSTKNHGPMEIVRNEMQVGILNDFLEVYVLNSTNQTCQRASDAYHKALVRFEPWALKMLDASSKFQSGLIAGNFIEFGSYQQCIDVEAPITDGSTQNVIRGKHCILTVLPPERFLKKLLNYRGITEEGYKNVRQIFFNSTYKWSVCIPDACGPQDVYQHFKPKINEFLEGLNITLLDNVKCTTWEMVDEEYKAREIVVVVLVSLLVITVATSTIIEIYKKLTDNDCKSYETIFSIISNTRYIFKQNKNHKKMACLNGIRVLSILFVITGHRYLLSFMHASVNGFEFLEWTMNMSSQVILRGPVSVDSFLLLSAVLLTYNFLVHHQNGGAINLPMYYIHRYLRLTPSYAFWILIIANFSHRLGKGPEWDTKWRDVQQPCRDYWWSALLYAQSYVNPKEVCILQSWYLSIDTFYYVCAPVFLILLIKYKIMGFVTLIVMFLASMGANYGVAWDGRYQVQGLIDSDITKSDYFTKHYTLPHLRASPYIIGVFLGYLLFRTREKKVQMSPRFVAIGWISASFIMMTVLFTNRVFLDEDYEYDRFGNAFYLATHRSVFVLAVGWLIWACVHGYGGIVNRILSSDVFAVLGKLTYSVYLVHMQFQFYDYAAMKTAGYFSNMSMIQKSVSDTVISFFLGYFLAVMVECPIYRLSLLMFRKKGKRENEGE